MKVTTHLSAIALVLSAGLATSAAAGQPGKSGIPTHPTEPLPEQTVECTPRPGTESMDHDPKDHPMPNTRGMKNMDPAAHMVDCVDPNAPPAPENIHDHDKHKKTGGG